MRICSRCSIRTGIANAFESQLAIQYIDIRNMGCLWLVRSIQLYISFAEYRLFYRALLQMLSKVSLLFNTLIFEIWGAFGWQDRFNYSSLLQNIVSFIGLFCKCSRMSACYSIHRYSKYGVPLVGKIDSIIHLFCRISSLL